jgi:adenylate cyclase
VAEIELEREGEAFERPDWALNEVSEDPRYFNAGLSKAPFKTWPETRR